MITDSDKKTIREISERYHEKLNEIQKIVERRKDEIIKEWKKHFGKH